MPCRVASAAINKAQGQTLQRVGIYLAQPCFSHGQLYVAASRVGHPDHIKFALQRDADGHFRTPNVVYRAKRLSITVHEPLRIERRSSRALLREDALY